MQLALSKSEGRPGWSSSHLPSRVRFTWAFELALAAESYCTWYRNAYDFFSASFLSSSFTADLKFLIPSPRPFPRSANLLGPKSKSAMPTISKRCKGWNSPSIIPPYSRTDANRSAIRRDSLSLAASEGGHHPQSEF